MTRQWRRFLGLILVSALIPIAAGNAHAAWEPNKPIEFVVPTTSASFPWSWEATSPNDAPGPKIAATAASYGVTLCPHWFHDLHVHLVAATANARYVEFFPDDQVLNFRRLIDTQLEARKGELVLPATPGLGFGFDEKAVARYTLGTGKSAWNVLK